MAVDMRDTTLIPFYVTTGLYFLFAQPLLGYPEQSITSALLKVLPIWSLAFYVYSKRLAKGTNESPYISACFIGLLFSSIGDIFIVWHDTLFDLGVAAFAVAHVFYLIGMLSRYKRGASSAKLMYSLIVLSVLLFVVGDIELYSEKVMFVAYYTLLGYLAWLATAHDVKENTSSSFYAKVGMCLFLISDSLIIINRVSLSLPCCEFVVMLAYYAAQWCLAVSMVLD